MESRYRLNSRVVPSDQRVCHCAAAKRRRGTCRVRAADDAAGPIGQVRLTNNLYLTLK
jgi:hypothetical protein